MTAQSKKLEKLAHAINVIHDEYRELKHNFNALKEENELLQKRAMAENILIACNENKTSPSGLQTHTIDEFLKKRAQLESSSNDHLEKVASMVNYFEDKSDYELLGEPEDKERNINSLHDFLNRI